MDGTDLGLGVGGRVKLIHVALIQGDGAARPRPELSLAGPRATALDIFPDDPSQLFVASSSGSVWRCCRFGEPEPPRVYDAGAAAGGFGGGFASPCGSSALTLHFSPFLPRYFLVGFGNGSLNLCKVDASLPLATWELTTSPGEGVTDSYAGVRCVRWSPSRPAVFFVLDEAHTLHVWDLFQDERGPVFSEGASRGNGGGGASTFCLSSDAVTTRQPSVALGKPSGEIEVHVINTKLSRRGKREVAELKELVGRLM